jgi:hypothetical protein
MRSLAKASIDRFALNFSKADLGHEADPLLRRPSGTVLLKWGEVKTERIYRLTVRLTPGSGPRFSEADEVVFRISDIQAAFDNHLEPLFPNDPETYWPQWQDPKPLPATLWQELKLPTSRKSSR